jgi:choline dehydrogenase
MIRAVEAYNYIVVGAGTAGCVLAARLSEEPGARVLLLEAGTAERTRAMAVPNAWPENLGSAADWGYVTTSQAEAGPLPYPRGRALGGSGAINAMAHVRGHPAVYDRWAAGGAPGWGFADLLPWFRRTERAEGHDPALLDQALRGTDGPIRVAPAADRHPVARAFAEALTRSGCPVTDDLSGRAPEGVTWADLAIADGERVSPADGYLRPALGRPNLDVATGAVVTRLTMRHGRCAGVSYVRDGAAAGAVVDTPAGPSAGGSPGGPAGGEVILAAGAIGSPYLLLRSGIGPAGPCGRWASTRWPTSRGWAGTSRIIPPPRSAGPRRRHRRPAGTTTGRLTRRCAANWPARFPTCTCSRSCCRCRRVPGSCRPPRVSSWWPRR